MLRVQNRDGRRPRGPLSQAAHLSNTAMGLTPPAMSKLRNSPCDRRPVPAEVTARLRCLQFYFLSYERWAQDLPQILTVAIIEIRLESSRKQPCEGSEVPSFTVGVARVRLASAQPLRV